MSSTYLSILGIFVKDLAFYANRLPNNGETVIGNNISFNPGGKGTNQAIAAKRSGSDVNFITKVGNDDYGREAIELLSKEKINTDNVFISKDTATGTAGIFIDSDGENSIIVYPGASSDISKKEILFSEKIIIDSSIFLTQLELPIDIIIFSLQVARKNNITTILNPAPANKHILKKLSFCDIITPNVHEASVLSGINIKNNTDIESAGKILLKTGVKEVIVTKGDQGFTYISDTKIKHIQAMKYGKAVDTSGAGDAFNGALVSRINEGYDTLSSCEFANAAAAISVTKMGTSLSIPFRKEIEFFLGEI